MKERKEILRKESEKVTEKKKSSTASLTKNRFYRFSFISVFDTVKVSKMEKSNKNR